MRRRSTPWTPTSRLHDEKHRTGVGGEDGCPRRGESKLRMLLTLGWCATLLGLVMLVLIFK
jgi:hypothetical protein